MKLNKMRFIAFSFGVAAASIFLWFFFLKTPSLVDLNAKGGYALGRQMGLNLMKQKIVINPKVFVAGIVDAQNGTMRLSAEEQQNGINYLHSQAALNMKNTPTPPVKPSEK